MFNLIVTVLATTAVLTEAAPGGGYYKHKSHGYKKPAPAPATRTAAPGDLVVSCGYSTVFNNGR